MHPWSCKDGDVGTSTCEPQLVWLARWQFHRPPVRRAVIFFLKNAKCFHQERKRRCKCMIYSVDDSLLSDSQSEPYGSVRKSSDKETNMDYHHNPFLVPNCMPGPLLLVVVLIFTHMPARLGRFRYLLVAWNCKSR